MSVTKTSLEGALLVDFTGGADGFKSLEKFDEQFASLIRSDKKPHAVIVVDRAIDASIKSAVVVRDHLNLTGHSPLSGPNHPIGERFPVVQGIYIEDALPELKRVVAAGLVHGAKPSTADLAKIKELGGEVACCNLVPAMIIAAHARCKVLGILVPEKLTPELTAQLKGLVGSK